MRPELIRIRATGSDVSLADPPGLYLDSLVAAGLETPNGTDPHDFWHVERGDSDHAVRASFEVPEELGYSVGDITIGGRTRDFGAQLAERVHVRIEALGKPSTTDSVEPRPCVS
jgi:hypothetical protein